MNEAAILGSIKIAKHSITDGKKERTIVKLQVIDAFKKLNIFLFGDKEPIPNIYLPIGLVSCHAELARSNEHNEHMHEKHEIFAI